MTGKEFLDYIRFNTRTTNSTFSVEEIILLMNSKMIYLAKKIEGVDEDYFGSPEFRDLVSTSVTREYPLPSDMLGRFKRAEVKLGLGDKWVVPTEFDLNMYDRPTDEESIVAHAEAQGGRVEFEIFRNSFWLYSKAIPETIPNGLKLWSYAYPTPYVEEDLADDEKKLSDPKTNDTNAIPESFHELWALMVCVAYKNAKQLPIPYTEREQSLKLSLAELLNDMSPMNRDRVFEAGSPDLAKQGDYGYNY